MIDPSALNVTHDPSRKSWLESANAPDVCFPIQNLPFGVFRRLASHEDFRVGVAIGDQILDVAAVHRSGVTTGDARMASATSAFPSLNRLMSLGISVLHELRLTLSDGLRAGSTQQAIFASHLIAQKDAQFKLPADIGDYTDFYSSIHHATAVGLLFRPDHPLLPNYKWVPIGYHGRSSSIGISGQQFPRPCGQRRTAGTSTPIVGPSEQMDYEVELGIFIGSGNALGVPVPLDTAETHVFGICLLNDWSARDLQAWEYQPLGPFLAKNFATTISPWVVTMEALAPFRSSLMRPHGDPQPLPYLNSNKNQTVGAIDIRLVTQIQTDAMRARGERPNQVSSTSFRHCYWTLAQLVTHHTVNGCNLRPGDLLGTGTQSGPDADEAGSLLELSNGGRKPITISANETRTFLQDGDSVTIRGWCEKRGATSIGFGEVVGRVTAALR